jgi:hypothetical protein
MVLPGLEVSEMGAIWDSIGVLVPNFSPVLVTVKGKHPIQMSVLIGISLTNIKITLYY